MCASKGGGVIEGFFCSCKVFLQDILLKYFKTIKGRENITTKIAIMYPIVIFLKIINQLSPIFAFFYKPALLIALQKKILKH